MSQHDFEIANQGFPAFRSDLNNALQALASNSSGTTTPSTTYANMFWYDETNNQIKIRNEDDDAFITLFTLNQSTDAVTSVEGVQLSVDTSPQLGGDLDTNGNNVNFGDSDKAQFGAGNDLQIYHDGSHSYISDQGTGDLKILADNFVLNNAANSENYITATANSAVTLYYNGSAKLATGNTGVSVTGNFFASGNIGLDSTDYIAWSNNSYLSFYVNGNEEARLESDGDFHADGDVIAYSTTISDQRLKSEITNIENALDKVGTINGVTFVRNHNGQKSAGVIAQEIMEVLPEAVKEKSLPLQTGTDDQYYVVEYDAVTGLLVEAVKELKARVEALEAK